MFNSIVLVNEIFTRSSDDLLKWLKIQIGLWVQKCWLNNSIYFFLFCKYTLQIISKNVKVNVKITL